jgi:hypothetical protein
MKKRGTVGCYSLPLDFHLGFAIGRKPLIRMVGAAGFEPAAPTMSTHRDFKDSKD